MRDFEESNDEGNVETREITVLRLHPNYCGDGMASSYLGDFSNRHAFVPKHATLPTEFFSENSATAAVDQVQRNEEIDVRNYLFYEFILVNSIYMDFYI